MMSISVIVILAILALSAYFGYKKGLIKTLYSLFAVIITLVITVVFAPKVSNYIHGNEKIYNKIRTGVEKSVEQSLESSMEIKDALKGDETVDDIDGLALPKGIKDTIKEKKDYTVNEVKKQITDKLTEMIISAIAFLGVFVAISIALIIIVSLLDIISKLPGINMINKWGGLLVGACKGILLVWILFILITAFASTDLGGKLFTEINSNPVTSYVYNHNYLMKFIK